MTSLTQIPALRVAVLLVSSLVLGASPSGSADKPASADALAFLAGSWVAKKWGGSFRAHYSTPEGGKVLSHSTLLNDEKIAFYEFEVFESREGTLTVTPYPGGKAANRFTATSSKKSKAVFENPSKDFPTRITYELLSPDSLRITLDNPHAESTEGERSRVEIFDLKRVKVKKQ